jgi:hypothetical protein
MEVLLIILFVEWRLIFPICNISEWIELPVTGLARPFHISKAETSFENYFKMVFI